MDYRSSAKRKSPSLLRYCIMGYLGGVRTYNIPLPNTLYNTEIRIKKHVSAMVVAIRRACQYRITLIDFSTRLGPRPHKPVATVSVPSFRIQFPFGVPYFIPVSQNESPW